MVHTSDTSQMNAFHVIIGRPVIIIILYLIYCMYIEASLSYREFVFIIALIWNSTTQLWNSTTYHSCNKDHRQHNPSENTHTE